MSLFLVAAILGGVGLVAMALLGMGAHGTSGAHGAGHAGGHAGGGSNTGLALAHGAKIGGGVKVGAGKGGGGARVTGIKGATKSSSEAGASFVWLFSLLSPRVLFSLCFGFGVAGLIAEHVFTGLLAIGVAVVGGVAFEAVLVAPLWRLLLRFSRTATTLDSSLFATARAVTSFDKDGHGLVSLEVDGQVVQLLARLDPESFRDAATTGARVHVGDELVVEEIDDVRQRCRVSVR